MPTLDIDEQTFETSFAEMALTSLKNKSPALVDYMMGFQLVDRSDDDTRAVGFFGFKIGSTWVYVPSFFLAGKVKGAELLYVKDQDVFLPNEDGWVNYLIKRKPFILGRGADKDRKPVSSGIDLEKLRTPPQTKLGNARGDGFIIYGTETTADWAGDGMGMFLPGEKVSSVTLPQFLAHRNRIDSYLSLMRKNAKVAAATLSFYTEHDFRNEQEKVASIRKKAAAGGMQELPSPVGEDDQVVVLDKADVDANAGSASFLDTESKKDLMRGKVVVVDNRNGNNVRKAYTANLTKLLSNPTDPGLYDVLTVSGNFTRMLVLYPATVGGGGNRDLRFVVDPSSGDYSLSWKSQIFVSKQYDRAETEKAVARMGMAVDKNPTTGEHWEAPRYIIVDPAGNRALGPFTVSKKLQNSGSGAQLLVKSVTPSLGGRGGNREDRMDQSDSLPFEGPMFSEDGEINLRNDGSEGYWGTCSHNGGLSQIILTDKKLTKMVHSGDVTMVPVRAGFRMLKLGDALTGVKNMGTVADLHLGIGKFAELFKVYSDGRVFNVTSESGEANLSLMDKKAVYRHLLQKMSLDKESADEIIKTASEKAFTSQRYYATRLEQKTAAPFDRINNAMGFDAELGVPIQDTSFGGGTFDEELPEESVAGDPSVYENQMDDNDAFEQYYKADMEGMDKAVQTGQKDVFDAAAIGALINIDKVDDELDSFVPHLISALDKLGRTLFLIYWHGDEVQERFGKQEVKDLEDNVKSVFTKLGDVILDLKTQSPADEDFIDSKNML